MNLFFGIKNNIFYSELTIPKFKNRQKDTNKKIKLFSAKIVDKKWDIKMIDCKENESFYFLNKEKINEKVFFFLASEKEIDDYKNSGKELLINFNSFSDTWPAYRSNLRICNNFGGFSSYQSEYPHSMTTRKGSVISSIDLLLNKTSDKNFVIFVNILKEPIEKNFKLFLINIKKQKIIKKFSVSTNKTNFIEIENEFISSENYMFSKDYLGIPIFISQKNNHISFEHTQPPHEYLIGKNKFLKVSELKNRANEIIDTQNI